MKQTNQGACTAYFPETGLACGPVRDGPGSPVSDVVVVGGTGGGSVGNTAVEIFNIGSASWRTGEFLMNTTWWC